MKTKMTGKTRESLTGLAYVSLWIAGFALLTLYPMIETFMLSLNNVAIQTTGIKKVFVGLGNYREALLSDTEFVPNLITYLTEIVIYVPVILVFSLLIALLLDVKMKGRGIFRTIFFLPVIIMSGPVMKQLMVQGSVALPGIERLIDLQALTETLPQYLANAIVFLVSNFVMILWFCGIQILIFLAVLQKMDRAMYEAANIDGASAWEVFWKLTLPALNPTIVVVVIFTVVTQSHFALSPVINQINNSLFKPGFGYGIASAMAWVYFIVMILVLALFTAVVSKREK